jgi:glucose-6-phosphate isomerase
MKVNIDYSGCLKFINEKDILTLADESVEYLKTLIKGEGEGSDFIGWLSLPEDVLVQIPDINSTAITLRENAYITVVVGIGGSYLGSKAIIEALRTPFAERGDQHEIIFAGQNISEDYLSSLLKYLGDKKFNIIVISKSGTTTEPAIAFRLLRKLMEESQGKTQASKSIVAVTDSEKGALRKLASIEGYKTYIIPDDVGGRFSVLTPVGLLPMAVAGIDISKLVLGAGEMAKRTLDLNKPQSNPALIYAATRNLLYSSGLHIELLSNFDPALHFIAEWWKQLFGESEGKGGKGLFPASVDLTTDLHSMGQYIQDGERILFETVLSVNNIKSRLVLPDDDINLDKLNYIAGKRISEVNNKAMEGCIMAHIDGKVPVIRIDIPVLDENSLGQLLYLFEISCALSGYILGVNPFDQPGVEAYKRNMFALLGK